MATPEHESQSVPHEVIHLPPPSFWPVTMAIGLALVLTGLVLNLLMTALGALISLVSIALWVRDARREFSDLPKGE